MAVQIFEPGEIISTKAIVSVIPLNGDLVAAFELEIPNREAFNVDELSTLLDGLEQATQQITRLYDLLIEENLNDDSESGE